MKDNEFRELVNTMRDIALQYHDHDSLRERIRRALIVQSPVDVLVSRCVIRLRTTAWSDGKGLHMKKSLTFMRKHCEGFNILEEDASMIGVDEMLPKITNLNECDDGLYRVVTCNESREWETGHIDDYDYRLVPFVPANGQS